jgi:hypothetical protein
MQVNPDDEQPLSRDLLLEELILELEELAGECIEYSVALTKKWHLEEKLEDIRAKILSLKIKR